MKVNPKPGKSQPKGQKAYFRITYTSEIDNINDIFDPSLSPWTEEELVEALHNSAERAGVPIQDVLWDLDLVDHEDDDGWDIDISLTPYDESPNPHWPFQPPFSVTPWWGSYTVGGD